LDKKETSATYTKTRQFSTFVAGTSEYRTPNLWVWCMLQCRYTHTMDVILKRLSS